MEYYLAMKKNKLHHLQENGTRDHHVKQNKLSSKGQVLHVFTHVKNTDLK
jgi:hypothetical protein